jgi:hypothetical protein
MGGRGAVRERFDVPEEVRALDDDAGGRIVDGRGTWLRWQSAPAITREQLARAWQQADLWSQNPGEEERRREVAVTPLAEWQVFYFRGNFAI